MSATSDDHSQPIDSLTTQSQNRARGAVSWQQLAQLRAQQLGAAAPPAETQQARAARLQAEAGRLRQQLQGRAEWRGPATDAALQALTVQARARTGQRDAPGPRAIKAPIGAASVENPKIHARDLHRIRYRVDGSRFLTDARAAAKRRAKGDPKQHTITAIAQALHQLLTQQAQGFCRVNYEGLGKAVGVCRETARKAIRLLERAELVDTVNVMNRRTCRDGLQRICHDWNCYLLRTAAPASAAAREEEPAAAGERAASVIARWAGYFGLAIRPRGWNRTPLRSPTG